jgi:hypothetical protein
LDGMKKFLLQCNKTSLTSIVRCTYWDHREFARLRCETDSMQGAINDNRHANV